MKRNLLFSGIALAVGTAAFAMLLNTGCKDKSANPPPPNKPPITEKSSGGPEAVPGQPSAAGPKIVSAEKNSFQEVTSKLDPGGNLFVYVSSENWINNVSQKVGDFREIIGALPGQSRRDREQIGQVFDLVQRLVKRSGVEDISGVGMSGIAVEKGLYRSKLLIHHYPGKANGCLWTTFGAKAHAARSLDLLPTNTVLAVFTDLEVEDLWSTLHKEAVTSGIPELEDFFRTFAEKFNQELKLDFDKARASLGGEVGLVLTADEERPVPIPLPNRMTITVPTLGLMLAVKVNDDLIFDRIDQQLTKDQNLSQMVTRVEEPDLKMRVIQLPFPLPMPLRPTVARHGEYLLIASSDDLVRAAVSAKGGKIPGLKSTAEFKRLARDLPVQGNGFSFVSQKFSDTLVAVFQNVAQNLGRTDPAAQKMMSKTAGLVHIPYGYSIAANTDEGWMVMGNSSKDPSSGIFASAFVAPVGVAGMLSAIAIPNFVKARSTAQQNACINNLRQLDGAKEQWALELKKTATDTPTWNDLIGTDKYIKVRPVCPAGGRYTLGDMSTKPRCRIPNHNLPGDR